MLLKIAKIVPLKRYLCHIIQFDLFTKDFSRTEENSRGRNLFPEFKPAAVAFSKMLTGVFRTQNDIFSSENKRFIFSSFESLR